MQADGRETRSLTVVLVLAVVALFGYLAWVAVSPIDLPFQRVNKSMQVTSNVDGHTLYVKGTTNLPDGAFIDWALWRESIDDNSWPSGQAAVMSGTFGFAADLTGLSSGNTTAEVSFSCDWGTVQPTPVTDIVGQHCEHLGGEQVYVDSPGDSKQLVTSARFTVP